MKIFEIAKWKFKFILLMGSVLLAGLVVTALVFRYIQKQVEGTAKREFAFVCSEVQDKIADRLNAHEQILRSAASFFEDSDGVTRQEWSRFTGHQKIEQHLPGIQGLGFAQLIPRAQLAQHIQEVRAEGFPEYQVYPEGERELYSSIIYLEPFAGRNLRAFGYDMFSEPVRRAAMERARDEDVAALSGAVRLVQETDQDVQAGTLMYVPVYALKMPCETVDQRRAAIRGWVYSPYRMTDLMRGILGRSDLVGVGRIHLRIFDGESATPAALLYDSQPAAVQSVGAASPLTLQRRVVVAGRPWILHYAADAPPVAGMVWLVLVGGAAISLLLVGFLFNLLNTRFKAEQIALRLTQELRASEFRWKFAVEGSGDGLWDWDVPAGTVFFSRRWKAMLGLAEDEVGQGLDEWRNRVHPDDLPSAMATIKAHFDNQTTSYANEHRVRCKDGSWKWILARGVVLSRDSAGKPLRMIGTHEDITERKQAEAEHAKLQAQFVQSQKMESVGRLAGGVAHDFNNLLMGIMGYVDLAREQLPMDHPVYSYLDEIKKEAKRSADLTRQLLTFARRQVVQPKVLDVNESVEGILNMLRRLIGEDVSVNWCPGQAIWPVRMDPSQIDQVLANLGVNARDAIGGVGCITINTANMTLDPSFCSEHPEFLPGDYVMLSVSDTGCGMNQEMLKHIFEPFFTTKPVGEGTGLGLATVYGIVSQNNGHIDVESESGKGTIFRIYLPRFVGQEVSRSAVVPSDEVPLGNETILLVEDEQALRLIISKYLGSSGYKVLAAESPKKALRLASEFPDKIHLLVTDVIMPGMNGRDLAQRLSTERPELKTMFISGFTADIIAKRGILDDSMNFLSKPFSRDVLARKVREVLGT